MTEEEAKTKWCPFSSSRVIQRPTAPEEAYVAAILEPETNQPSTLCIASSCMAFRWMPERLIRTMDELEPVKTIQHGFCGLVGAPQ